MDLSQLEKLMMLSACDARVADEVKRLGGPDVAARYGLTEHERPLLELLLADEGAGLDAVLNVVNAATARALRAAAARANPSTPATPNRMV